MPEFTFELAPSGISQVHDVLLCLSKFDENVMLEASNQEVTGWLKSEIQY